MFCFMFIASLSVEVRSLRVLVSTSLLLEEDSETDMNAFSIIDSSALEERASLEISRKLESGEAL